MRHLVGPVVHIHYHGCLCKMQMCGRSLSFVMSKSVSQCAHTPRCPFLGRQVIQIVDELLFLVIVGHSISGF